MKHSHLSVFISHRMGFPKRHLLTTVCDMTALAGKLPTTARSLLSPTSEGSDSVCSPVASESSPAGLSLDLHSLSVSAMSHATCLSICHMFLRLCVCDTYVISAFACCYLCNSWGARTVYAFLHLCPYWAMVRSAVPFVMDRAYLQEFSEVSLPIGT